jgi:hypothetical protein
MPAHSLLLSSIPSEGRAVFSISLRDLVPSADTRATEGSERAIFLMSAGLCWVTICAGFLSLSLSVGLVGFRPLGAG